MNYDFFYKGRKPFSEPVSQLMGKLIEEEVKKIQKKLHT